jgi:hypothetical protein
MRSPDHTDVRRVDALIAGAPPESEREARLEALIRDLRATTPPAPPALRERVQGLREPEPQSFSWRPLLVALPIAAALVAGVVAVSRGDSVGDRAAGGEGTVTEARSQVEGLRASPGGEVGGSPADARAAGSTELLVPARDPTRAQEWDVALELRVRDNDRLSEASSDAIRTTRELGGYVVSSSVATSAQSGEARLVVRVPSRRIQDAIARLSDLGTITSQHVAIEDRQDELDRMQRRIDALRVQRAELRLRLRTETLTAPERLRLELRLQRLAGLLNSLAGERAGVAREVALAEVTLTVRTGTSAAPPSEGRIEGAARDALRVLAVAGAAAVFVAIILVPVLVLGAGGWLVRRSLRRRSAERLLERPGPAAARESG